MINLTEKDNGTTVSAKKDNRIVVTLPWNPSSGFYWKDVDSTAGTLESIRHDGEDPKPGSSAIVIFTFHIQKNGSIVLNYARPWSETTPPEKWFFVEIKDV